MAFDVSYVFKAINQFSAVAKEVWRSLEGVRSKAKDVSVQVGRTGKAFVTNFKGRASRAIAFVKNKLTGLDKKFKSFGKSVSSFGRELSTKVSAPLIALGGVALVQSAKMETLQISFETMLGSVDKAKKLVSDLTSFTASTPFKLQGVGKSAKTLLAFGVTNENMIKTLRMLGDVAAGTESPLADIAQIFGKAKAKGKLMTEELLQLSERGIPIIADLAKQYGVTEAQVFEAASKSQISFKIMQDSLIRLTSQGGIFFDQTRRQSESLEGRFSTLVDNLLLFASAIGDVLVSVFGIKEGISGLTDKLTGLPDKIKLFAAENPAMIKFIAITAAVVIGLGPLLIGLGLFIAILPLVGAGLAILFSPIVLVGAAIAGLAFVIFKNFDAIQLFIADSIESVINKFKMLVDTFKNSEIGGSLLETGKSFVSMWSSIFDFMVAGWKLIGTVAPIVWDSISSSASSAFDSVMNTFITPLIEALSPVTDLLSNIFGPMELSFSGVLDVITLKFSDFIEGLIGGIGSIAGAIGSFFSGGAEKLNEINKSLKNEQVVNGQNTNSFFNNKEATALRVVESNGTLTSPLQQKSQSDITVNIKAPEGVVKSIQTQRSGDTEAMNLGVNMQSAG